MMSSVVGSDVGNDDGNEVGDDVGVGVGSDELLGADVGKYDDGGSLEVTLGVPLGIKDGV